MEPSEKKFYNIALEYYIQGKYKKAIEFSKKALKVKTSYLDAHLLLANTYSKLGKNDKTELYLTNALKIEPNNTNVISGVCCGINEEVQRVVKGLKFAPAMQNGIKMRMNVMMNFPVKAH